MVFLNKKTACAFYPSSCCFSYTSAKRVNLNSYSEDKMAQMAQSDCKSSGMVYPLWRILKCTCLFIAIVSGQL